MGNINNFRNIKNKVLRRAYMDKVKREREYRKVSMEIENEMLSHALKDHMERMKLGNKLKPTKLQDAGTFEDLLKGKKIKIGG